jgi:hypothetical protein
MNPIAHRTIAGVGVDGVATYRAAVLRLRVSGGSASHLHVDDIQAVVQRREERPAHDEWKQSH